MQGHNINFKTLTLSDVRKEYRRLDAVGTQPIVRRSPSSETDTNPVVHFVASVNDLCDYAL